MRISRCYLGDGQMAGRCCVARRHCYRQLARGWSIGTQRYVGLYKPVQMDM